MKKRQSVIEVNNDDENEDVVYDLFGRRTTNVNGISIRRGKKVVIFAK